jgi:hypothetical protein
MIVSSEAADSRRNVFWLVVAFCKPGRRAESKWSGSYRRRGDTPTPTGGEAGWCALPVRGARRGRDEIRRRSLLRYCTSSMAPSSTARSTSPSPTAVTPPHSLAQSLLLAPVGALLHGAVGAVMVVVGILSPCLWKPTQTSQKKAVVEPFSELPAWGLEARDVVGTVGYIKRRSLLLLLLLRRRLHELLALGLTGRHAIQHVVNPVLQTAYERKKKALAARLGGVANVNEQFLFHGTTLANSDAIISNNFCLTKVRKRITMPL